MRVIKNIMTTHLIFVYGTLKRKQPNEKVMEDVSNGIATFLGRGKTNDSYPLVIASEYNIPFLLFKKNSGKIILGEVYKVDDKMLATLDDFEGHPAFYEREQIDITVDDGVKLKGDNQSCWCYFLKKIKPKLLSLPTYSDYDAKGEHGLTYVARLLLFDGGNSKKWMLTVKKCLTLKIFRATMYDLLKGSVCHLTLAHLHPGKFTSFLQTVFDQQS